MQVLIQTEKSYLAVYDNYSPDIFNHLNVLKLEHEPPSRMGIQRRDVGFFSDTSKGYLYSGHMMTSQHLSSNAHLKWLLDGVNASLGTNFNGILVNRYVDGSKNIGAHSDDEKGLGRGSIVAGISYGATRKFRIRKKSDDSIVLDYMWGSGTLLIMGGDFQKEFKHEIPKEMKVKNTRISVTFRHHTY